MSLMMLMLLLMMLLKLMLMRRRMCWCLLIVNPPPINSKFPRQKYFFFCCFMTKFNWKLATQLSVLVTKKPCCRAKLMRQNSIDQGTASDSLESNTTEKNDLASSSSSSVTSSCSSSSSLLPSYRLLPPPSFPSSSPSQRRRKCIVTTVWSCLKIYIFTFLSFGFTLILRVGFIHKSSLNDEVFLQLGYFVRAADLSDVRSWFTPSKESWFGQIIVLPSTPPP